MMQMTQTDAIANSHEGASIQIPTSQPSATVPSALAAALLTACGGSDSDSESSAGSASAVGFNNYAKAGTSEEAARFLMQSQFAATDADISELRGTDFATYLQRQYAKPITWGWDWLESQGYGADSTAPQMSNMPYIGDYMVWRHLFSAPDAMRKRMALALSEFMVVSLSGIETLPWRGYAITAYWDILNQHAFGNFRDLLEAITLNPAMGHYLNTKGNQKEDGKGRLPDENYAREIMQLFTIGLYELNLDGSVKTDSSGKKLETYDADDVSQLARVFTGYDLDYSAYANKVVAADGKKYWNREVARQPMKLDPNKHSNLAASFLGANIPANTPGATALKTALDTLFNLFPAVDLC
jgi:uncharacterized protein (DUF1800 family)